MRCSSWAAQVKYMSLGRRGSTDADVSLKSGSEAGEARAKDEGSHFTSSSAS